MSVDSDDSAPILTQKHYAVPSAFTPESLLREARRQRRIPVADIPAICLLDPDGDIVRSLVAARRAQPHPTWACYHTRLYSFSHDGVDFGIVQILPVRPPPYFVVIDRALRDEGTSYHYMAPSMYSHADQRLLHALQGTFDGFEVPVLIGATWTTDAPFRETQPAIETMRERQLLAVEMEAAALYAFAEVRKRPVLCFAHVTNQMGRVDGDFEKGEADGSRDALNLMSMAARRLRARLSL
jgi:uridine phosphorylase